MDWLKNSGDSLGGSGVAGSGEGGLGAWLAKVFFDLWPLVTVSGVCAAVWYGNILGLMPPPVQREMGVFVEDGQSLLDAISRASPPSP